jgi:hypothetical protein
MSLSTLQLASTSTLALLAGLPDATQAQSIVLEESALLRESTCANPLRVWRTSRECGVSAGDDLASHRLALDVDWKTKWTAADVLTELLDVDGIRVVADRHLVAADGTAQCGDRHPLDGPDPGRTVDAH